jgi:hypothetical protein
MNSLRSTEAGILPPSSTPAHTQPRAVSLPLTSRPVAGGRRPLGARDRRKIEAENARIRELFANMTDEEIEELRQEGRDFLRQSEDEFGESYDNEWGYR